MTLTLNSEEKRLVINSDEIIQKYRVDRGV